MNQKRIVRVAFLLACAVCLTLVSAVPGYAMEGTAYTFTMSADQSKLLPTMDAYLPAGTYLGGIGLNSPEDMFLDGRTLYIADTGNRRIVVCSLNTGRIETFGEEELKKPTGISVDGNGNIYVADYGAEQVVVFAPDYTVSRCLTRPAEVYYGTSPYKPQKVDLDSYGNLFVISEGTYEGILQFDKNGTFNGFFGANKTKGLSAVEWFQKIFYTDEQKAKMTFRTPPNIVALDVSDSDMVFSVTQNDAKRAIKKLNMAGVNIYADNSIWGLDDYADVAVLPGGTFYVVSVSGWIDEFNEEGEFLLEFGGEAKKTDRNGLTAVVSAIEADEAGNLYILDKERGVIQIWYPTEYARLLHKAEADFTEGSYEESLAGWKEILRMNPNAYMSNLGYAKALFQLGRYEEAAEHFAEIEYAPGYSDCFWETRSAWMRSHMEGILIGVILFAALCFALNLLDKRYGWKEAIRERYEICCRKHRLLQELTGDVSYFLRHPIDGVYYLKTGRRGSVPAATILYVTAIAVYMVCRGLTSFVFGGGYSYDNDPVAILLIIIVPSVLFLIGSYLISAIHDGEGSFRAVYVCFAYSLSAFILCWPALTLLSHAFTLTELFIYRLLAFLILGYTGVLIFISIKEAHVYNLRKTVANILLTLFFMVVAILAAIVLYILWRELLSFLSEVFEEVRYRVFS